MYESDAMSNENAIVYLQALIAMMSDWNGRPRSDAVFALQKAVASLEQEKRKKGQWIKMSDADGIYYACNVCGEDIPRVVTHFDPRFDLSPRLKSIEKTNFCPNCGARMDKGEAE